MTPPVEKARFPEGSGHRLPYAVTSCSRLNQSVGDEDNETRFKGRRDGKRPYRERVGHLFASAPDNDLSAVEVATTSRISSRSRLALQARNHRRLGAQPACISLTAYRSVSIEVVVGARNLRHLEAPDRDLCSCAKVAHRVELFCTQCSQTQRGKDGLCARKFSNRSRQMVS